MKGLYILFIILLYILVHVCKEITMLCVASEGFLAPRTVNGTKMWFIMILQCYLYKVAQPCGQYVSTLTGRHSLLKRDILYCNTPSSPRFGYQALRAINSEFGSVEVQPDNAEMSSDDKIQAVSRTQAVPWFEEFDDSKLSPAMTKLLEEYSGIARKDIKPHIVTMVCLFPRKLQS
jgi:hypothetical protein